MIWYIYAVLLCLSVFLIILGYTTNETLYQLLGWSFMFLLGVALINGIEYISGYVDTYSYLTNTTSINTITQETSFTQYSNFLIGFYLAVVSGLGFIMSIMEYKGGRRND